MDKKGFIWYCSKMNEFENAALRHTLGVDSKGVLLTDERRAERNAEVTELVKQVGALHSEANEIDRAMRALDGRSGSEEWNRLNQRRNQIESQMQKIHDAVYKKSSTDYPALPDEA